MVFGVVMECLCVTNNCVASNIVIRNARKCELRFRPFERFVNTLGKGTGFDVFSVRLEDCL